jgi:hypothetical protein
LPYLGNNYTYDGLQNDPFRNPASPPTQHNMPVENKYPYDYGRPMARPPPPPMSEPPEMRRSLYRNGQKSLMPDDLAASQQQQPPPIDPLYSDEMDRMAGIRREKSKKKKKKDKGAVGLPDPQYLMMLKMMDPNIDMVKLMPYQDLHH